MKNLLLMLLAGAVIIAGCTPTVTKNTNSSDSKEDDAMMEEQDGDSMEQDAPAPAAQGFLKYENPAVSYSVDIPENWYWRHFHKAEIGAENPVDDYLMISPTHAINSLNTESPAEIIIEVSGRDVADFSDPSMIQSIDSVAGVEAVRESGVIDNQVFENYQKIEYRFVRDGKTYRLIYLAAAGSEANEATFEQIVDSFSF